MTKLQKSKLLPVNSGGVISRGLDHGFKFMCISVGVAMEVLACKNCRRDLYLGMKGQFRRKKNVA